MGELSEEASQNGEAWQSAEQTLARFDRNEDGALDFDEFKQLCLELFGPEEVAEHESKISEIFQALDVDGDGIISSEEWEACFNDWVKVILNPVNVFLIVDVQNDFIDGTLGLKDLGLGEDGNEVVEPINNLIEECPWAKVIYSLDWHPPDHISFYDNLYLRELHPKSKIQKEDAKLLDTVRFLEPDIEQTLWPPHCVFDTWGAELHKDLIIAPDSIQIKKGQNPDMDSYSAFFDNNADCATELPKIMEDLGATDIYMCGLAYDVCVRASCLDGLRLGYRVVLVENCCRGVSPTDIKLARQEIMDKGGLVLQTDEVKDYVDGTRRSLVMALKGAQTTAKRRQELIVESQE